MSPKPGSSGPPAGSTPIQGVPVMFPDAGDVAEMQEAPSSESKTHPRVLTDRERLLLLEQNNKAIERRLGLGARAITETREVFQRTADGIASQLTGLHAAIEARNEQLRETLDGQTRELNRKISAEVQAVEARIAEKIELSQKAAAAPRGKRPGVLAILGTVGGLGIFVLGVVFAAGRIPNREEYDRDKAAAAAEIAKLHDQAAAAALERMRIAGELNVALTRIGFLEARHP